MKLVNALFVVLIFGASCSKSAFNTQFETTAGKTVDIGGHNSVLMFLTPDCPLCHLYTSEFAKLSEKYADDVMFYGVLPGSLYSKKEVEHFVDSFNCSFPIIVDKHFDLTDHLGATTTPEFIVLDSTLQTIYQGKMDDWAIDLGQKKVAPTTFYLESAIKQFLSNEKVVEPFVAPVGCAIER